MATPKPRQSAPRPGALHPTARNRTLPPWAPPAPPHGGWTPATAWPAVWAYADDAAPALAEVASPKTIAHGAWVALCAVTPGLARTELVERMRGAEPFGGR